MKDDMYIDNDTQEIYSTQREQHSPVEKQSQTKTRISKINNFIKAHKTWTIVCSCACIALIFIVVMCCCFASVGVGEVQAKKLVLKAIENTTSSKDYTIEIKSHTYNDSQETYDATILTSFKKDGDRYSIMKASGSNGDNAESIEYFNSKEGILYEKTSSYTKLTGENENDIKSRKLTNEEIEQDEKNASNYLMTCTAIIPSMNYFSRAYRKGGVTTYVIDEKDETNYSKINIVEVSVSKSKISKIAYTTTTDDGIITSTFTFKYKFKKYELNKSEFGSAKTGVTQIEFGSYPQSLVQDSAINSALTNTFGVNVTTSWNSFNYYASNNQLVHMYYRDVTYNGSKYRGVYFTDYRPAYFSETSSAANSRQDDNTYLAYGYYWFKFEPIKWHVATEAAGSKLIVADLILDSQEFCRSINTTKYWHSDGNGYANSYVLSDIRQWLSSSFYTTAFSLDEKNRIVYRTEDNNTASSGLSNDEYSGVSISDKVFLLSYEELTTYFKADEISASGTEYAKVQGLEVYSNGNSDWWLRSAFNSATTARMVSYDEYISNCLVHKNSVGIRPACWVDI